MNVRAATTPPATPHEGRVGGTRSCARNALAPLLAAWSRLRAHAACHRGLLTVVPVFWAAFTIFVHPAWGAAGFAVHALIVLPRKPAAALALLALGPLLCVWFAMREPHLSHARAPGHRPFPADDAAADAPWRVGVVTTIPAPTARGWMFLFRERTEGERQGRLYRVTLEGTTAPAWGAIIRLQGRAAPADAPLNPGQLDMRRVLRGQGASAMIRAEQHEIITAPPFPRHVLMQARTVLSSSLTRNVPDAARPLLEASLLNITANVPEDTREAFLRSGMQHILAISGQHIGLLLGFLLVAGTCARLPRKATYLLAFLLTGVYIPLVGSPVSVVRSGIMFVFVLPAILRERQTAGAHALALTAALDLLLDPHNILNLGFQLSYAATLALILGTRPSLHAVKSITPRPLAATVQMILLSALITLFTYPVLAASTHATTPWGVVGNVATVPVGAAMLVGGLFTWSFDFLVPGVPALASWAGATAGACALLLEGLVFRLAALPGALRPIADAPPWWLATLVTTTGAVTILFRNGRARAALLVALTGLTAEAARPAAVRAWTGGARVTFLAVGHGDAAMLEMRGATILIDAGDSPRIARDILLPWLRHRGIARLDAVVITHPDLDHYGGAATLLARIPVGRVIAPPEADAGTTGDVYAEASRSPTWECFRNVARARGVPWMTGREGQRVYEDPRDTLWLLAPDTAHPALAHADKNDRSLVAWLRTPHAAVLFTGDIEHAGQEALAASWPLWRGAWLKAPHHGSDRTTLPCFLRAAAPPRAVVSCGGRRGFPGASVMATLADGGARTAVTKTDGAVTWTFGRHGAREERHLDAPGHSAR